MGTCSVYVEYNFCNILCCGRLVKGQKSWRLDVIALNHFLKNNSGRKWLTKKQSVAIILFFNWLKIDYGTFIKIKLHHILKHFIIKNENKKIYFLTL